MLDLVVGDIHATPDELRDVAALFDLIERVAVENDVQRIVFLGDLHHTFSVTNLKVTAFYRERFKKLARTGKHIVAIPGNHDMPGNGAQYPHALVSYEDMIGVIDQPAKFGNTMYLPYFADPNLFLKAVEVHSQWDGSCEKPLIYCHQEFNGAQYDNGYFAPHGADPGKMVVDTISGHIHTPQKLGNVWYIGAPRWRTLSDANVTRSLVLMNRRTNTSQLVDTGLACRRIWANQIIEGEDPGEIPGYNDKDEFRFYIEGSPEYVKANSANIKQDWPGARISTNVRNKVVRVRESDGIEVAFRKFATTFRARNATSPESLFEKAKVRVYG